MAKYQYRTEQKIDMPINKVFKFFTQAENLELLTPDWLNFRIITSLPIEMKVGTIIDYRIKLYGLPLYWKTEITCWEPPYRFIDIQIKGPYSVWIHEHRFEEHKGNTIMYDTVDYDIKAGLLTPLVQNIFIKKQIDRIFEYRYKNIEYYFSKDIYNHEL